MNTSTATVKSAKALSPGEAELIASSTPVDVPCPVCGSRDYSAYCNAPSHYTPETYRITRCRKCSMVFTNPQFTFYDRVAESRGTSSDFFNDAHLAPLASQGSFILSLIAPLVSGRRVLDFGCGEGAVVATGLKEGWDARGYDLNVAGMEEANRYWQTDVFEAGTFETTSTDMRHVRRGYRAPSIRTSRTAGGAREASCQAAEEGWRAVDRCTQRASTRRMAQQGQHPQSDGPPLPFFNADVVQPDEGLGCRVVYRSGAPSFFSLYRKLHLGNLAYPLGKLSKRMLPPIGTGVCVIGRKE